MVIVREFSFLYFFSTSIVSLDNEIHVFHTASGADRRCKPLKSMSSFKASAISESIDHEIKAGLRAIVSSH
jgi:hypothetical protein